MAQGDDMAQETISPEQESRQFPVIVHLAGWEVVAREENPGRSTDHLLVLEYDPDRIVRHPIVRIGNRTAFAADGETLLEMARHILRALDPVAE